MNTIDLKNPNRSHATSRFPGTWHVPASTSSPDLDELIGNAARVQEEHRVLADAVATHRAGLDQAVLDDRAKIAAAHVAGAPKKPDDKRLSEAQRQLRDAERLEEGARLAVAQCIEAVRDALDQHAEQWADRADTIVEQLRGEAADLLEPFLAKLGELRHAETETKWLRTGGQYAPHKLETRTLAGAQWPDIELELRRFVGTAAPAPVTLAEQIIAKGKRPAPEVALVRADGSPIPESELPEEAA